MNKYAEIIEVIEIPESDYRQNDIVRPWVEPLPADTEAWVLLELLEAKDD